jgi:hypothetical protein
LSPNEKKNVESKFSKPRNATQSKYARELEKTTNKIIIATGPAGTGKTLFGTEYGIKHFLMGDYDKLIFTRPAVSADEDLGYLPGSLEDKMSPWVRPIYDILHTFITPKEAKELLANKAIEIVPLAYMRGRTFKNAWIVADECQNTNINQFKMLLTRIGENSRMVITGDLDQHDRHDEVNGLADFLEKLRNGRSNSISSIEFDKNDIEREEVIKDVLDIYNGECGNPYMEDDGKSIGMLSMSPDSVISAFESIMEEKRRSKDGDKSNGMLIISPDSDTTAFVSTMEDDDKTTGMFQEPDISLFVSTMEEEHRSEENEAYILPNAFLNLGMALHRLGNPSEYP